MLNILNSLKSISKLLFQVLGLIGTDELVTATGVATEITTTSGLLVIGKTYNVVATLSTDDFANVGWVSDGVDFVATGTTPTVWTNSSVVINRTDEIPYVLDWSKGTYRITMTGNSAFAESNLPATGRASIIDIYLDGAFTPTFPVAWDVVIGTYDGAKKNQVVAKYINSSEYWVTITPDS